MSNYRYIPMQFYDSLADAKRTLKENSLTALQMQLSLLEWLERQASIPAYQQFMTTHGHRPITDESTRQMLGEFLHRSVRDVAAGGSTHWVNDDMSAICKLAAQDMRSTGLHAPNLPTDTGWMVYERPIGLVVKDAPDPEDRLEVRIAAIGWQVGTVRRAPLRNAAEDDTGGTEGTLAPGVSYYLFQTAHDYAVFQNILAEREGRDDRLTEDDVQRVHGPLPIFDFSGWAYNTAWNSVNDEELAGYADEYGTQNCLPIVDQARRLLLGTWKIFRQKNIVQANVTAQPNHKMRKRGKRVGFEPESGDIVIISMRQTVYRGLQKQAAEAGEADGEEYESWYKCKFLVRGHWHPYWTGPRVEGHCEHNLVEVPDAENNDMLCTLCGRTLIEKYVLPYPKGNPNGPFLLRDRITVLEQ